MFVTHETLWQTVELTLAAQIEILLLCACFQLRTYYLFETSSSDFCQEALIKAYATSLALISKVDTADANSDFTKYAPSYFSHILGMAAVLVMKMVSSSYSQYVDVEGGRRAFNTVLSLLRKCSVEDNDLKGRMSKILAQLWSVHLSDRARRDRPPSLTIKSRFCASILHDALWLWREKFGGPGYATAAAAATDTQTPPPGPESTSPLSAPTPDRRPEIATLPNPSMALPQAEFGLSDMSTLMPQGDHLPGPADHLIYDQHGLPTDYEHYDWDVAQEEHDWMWDFGLASVLPDNIDFYTNGFVPQDQMQQ